MNLKGEEMIRMLRIREGEGGNDTTIFLNFRTEKLMFNGGRDSGNIMKFL